MRVFKTTWTHRNGNKVPTKKWYIEFRDHLEIVRRLTAFPSKSLSEALGRNIEKLTNYRIAGETLDPQLSHWLNQLPLRLTKKFVSFGLLDINQVSSAKFLHQHLEDFKKSLRANGCTEIYIELKYQRIRKVLEGCEFIFWTDISASKVQQYIYELQTDESGISIRTGNYYLQAIKQFCKWMVQDRRAYESPLDYLQPREATTTYSRRALNAEEVTRLLITTANEPTRFNMEGSQRALLYRLAIETGLRALELRSLTPLNFNFEDNFVTINAEHAKNRKSSTLPLRKDTAKQMKAALRMKHPQAKVFKLPSKYNMAKMLRKDLETAGINWKDNSQGRIDFHALRHSTGSLLAASGAHPKVIQSIMRHSDINLTMLRYTHIFKGQESQAVENLPDFANPYQNRDNA